MHAKENNIQNDRIIRYAGWMWLVYIITLAVVDNFFLKFGPRRLLSPYYIANGLAAAVFIILSYWKKGFEKLGKTFNIVFIVLISIVPVVMNQLIAPRLPPGPLSNAEGMALRLFPVLFIGLVLTAWQFRFVEVALYSIAIAFVEMIVVYTIVRDRILVLTLFTVLNLVRTASFLSIGFFITRMMALIRQQQHDLRAANEKLTRYTHTMEELTISRERNRMARELHDTLAHSLTALSVQLETVKAYWDVDRLKAQDLLDKSLAVTRAGTEETRRALQSLRASPLDDLGLSLAIKQLAESVHARTGVDLDMNIDGDLSNLPLDAQHTVYRIVQEAIENVIKHAHAKSLKILLTGDTSGLRLEISDDGKGFSIGQDTENGFGLMGMRERAKLIGGELSLESQPGVGTTVRFLLKGESQ